ncbi:metal-nicotianamine transporter YSL3-like protein [Medicago truncatula]|uniref:Metal-nicotianamine transporter YSL3-like protein n=1 Tax=Medicago truncatula TaxID=3880 RepID=A0A072TRD4_MEDTR|nr:metal-nicotianamine transporter YSL3-like protein [Medicago truncatula]
MGSVSNDEQELKEIEILERDDIEKVGDELEDASRVAPWMKQITIRGLIASILIGIVYSVIVMKLNLTTGLVPNLNVSVALLGFVFIKLWTKILEKANIDSTPFTRQENTIIQTCAVACYSASF